MSRLGIETVHASGFALIPTVNGRTLRVKFTGSGDMEAVALLDRHLKSVHETALLEKLPEVDYDLEELYFLNSSCLKAFVAWVHEVRKSGGGYKIRFRTNPNLHWQKRSLDALRRLAPGVVTIDQAE